MGFFSVNSQKSIRQQAEVSSSLNQLRLDRGNLLSTKSRLVSVQHELAKELMGYQNAFNRLSNLRGSRNKALSGFARKTLLSILKTEKLNTGDAMDSFKSANGSIDSLVLEIDTKVSEIMQLQTRIDKPRIFRGQSSAALVARLEQKIHDLQGKVVSQAPLLEMAISDVLVEKVKTAAVSSIVNEKFSDLESAFSYKFVRSDDQR